VSARHAAPAFRTRGPRRPARPGGERDGRPTPICRPRRRTATVATYHAMSRRTPDALHPVPGPRSPRAQRPGRAVPTPAVTGRTAVVGDEAFAFGRLPHTIQTRGEACSNNVTGLEFTHTYTHLSTTLGSARGRRLSRGPRAAIVICTCVASGSHPCHDVSDTSFLHDFVFHTHRLPIARHAIVNVSARARSATRCPWLPVPTLVPYRCPDSLHR